MELPGARNLGENCANKLLRKVRLNTQNHSSSRLNRRSIDSTPRDNRNNRIERYQETLSYNHCGEFNVYARSRILPRTLLMLMSAVLCGRAFAGSPPLITDDPETPGYHGWEINITESGEHAGGEFGTESPLFDIN